MNNDKSDWMFCKFQEDARRTNQGTRQLVDGVWRPEKRTKILYCDIIMEDCNNDSIIILTF